MKRLFSPLTEWMNNLSIRQKLYFVMGIMAFPIAAELFILYFTVHTLSSTRAFVGGEGLYSKAQKDAAYNLRKYATSLNENDYRAFQHFISIPLGDKQARLELEKMNPDMNVAYAGFLTARNNREDIEGMIHLFTRFRHIYYIDKAISYWRKGDSLIDRLWEVSVRLHVSVTSTSPSSTKPDFDLIVSEIDDINSKLTILEDEFSYTLGEGSRWLENLIIKILFTVALTVESTGLFLTISLSKGITRGLNEIVQASGKIAKADFSVRASVRSLDELGLLAGSFNKMADDLEGKTREQQQIEENLRTQKDLYETLVIAQSEMGEGVIITDGDSIVFANPALCSMYGYSQEELLNIPSYFDLFPPEEIQIMESVRANRLAGIIGPATGETAVLRKDRKIIQVEYSRKIVQYENRTRIISIVRDMTEQKVSEKKMKELAAIVEASDDAIKTLSMDGIILNWNKGAETLFGFSAREIVGKHVSHLAIPGMEDEFAFLTDMIRKKKPINQYESIRKRKDGEPIYVSTTASPITDQNGNVSSIAIISRDISQSKKAATELKQKSEELIRSNTELEQFAYVISHDLREPVRTMGSYIQLLQTRYQGKLDTDANEFIGFAVAGAKRMNDLINDLLTYSRAGFSSLEFEMVDCKEVLEAVIGNLQESILTSGAHISTDPMPVVYANKLQMTQLFQNLIGNAIKFRGSASPQIQILVSESLKGWEFSVCDNGIGIDPKFAERIFIIFQRLHAAGEYEGTGIGLAICKKIVERHGGEIWFESEPGKGSVFHFRISPVLRKNDQ